MPLPTIPEIERYHGLKARLEQTLDRMHYNLAGATDLDGLDQLATALDRVICRGDRISVGTAQGVAAATRRLNREDEGEIAERAAAAYAALATDLLPAAIGAGSAAGARSFAPAGVSTQPPELGGPMQAEAPLLEEKALAVMEIVAAVSTDETTALPATSFAGAPLVSPLSPPVAPLEPLVLKQKPPIAKPGRGRGFVYKGNRGG